MASTLVTLPREVVLRSGQRVSFDPERIRAALASAGQASGENGAEEAALLTAQVTKVLIHRFHGEAPTVEQIQDVAEQTLIAANHLATARATSSTASSTPSSALTSRRWWMWKAPSTNTSRAPTGA